jgi:NAD(P)-dependent dehydrogenase (short-subunit alcohol dehydrogenase family)
MKALPELFDLNGRVAMVTGGAGLLGEQFCRTLAEAGAAVVIVDRNAQAGQVLVDDLVGQGRKVLAAPADVTSPSSVHAAVEAALDQFGRLDILVNSAALDPKFDPQAQGKPMGSGSFEDFPLEAWQQALDVNLTGAFLCCQAAATAMLIHGGGIIINISSMYGIVAPDQRLYVREGEKRDERRFKPVYYTVTKAGMLGLTSYLAAYYAGKNIRVNALTPGGIYNDHDEEFLKKYAARSVLGRMAQKDEMNGALLFLASDASSYMTGANLVLDGGWSVW